MNNYDVVLKAQENQLESAGLAANRYQIYMEGLEAATNKFTTSWEKMWMNAFPTSIIKWFIDLGTGVLDVVDALGLLNISIVSLLAVFAARGWGVGLYTAVTTLGPSIATLAQSFRVATSLGMSLNGTLNVLNISASAFWGTLTMGVGVAILGLIALFNELNVTTKEAYDNFEKLKQQSNDNISELDALASEYENLANKQDKSLEDTDRLLEIQTILNTKYGALKDGVNLYSDAINNNSIAIKENILWMQKQKEQEAKNFLEKNKLAYEDAKKFLSTKTLEVGGYTASGVGYTPEEEIRWLDEQISLGKDKLGNMRRQRDALAEELDLQRKIVIEYENYERSLDRMSGKAIPEVVGAYQRDQYVRFNDEVQQVETSLGELEEALKSQTQAMMDANDQLLSLTASYDEYGELTMEQVEQLKQTYPEDYFKALTIEGDKFKLNKEALKELVLAKVDAAIKTAEMALALDRENISLQNNLKVLQTYRNQILNGTALNTDAIQKQKQAQEDLLKDTITMIKERVNREKDALQDELRAFKETIDEKKQALEDYADQQKQNLQDELDRYKLIIDAEKRLIEQKDRARDHANAVSDKNKEIADIDNQLLALQFDNSEEAKARRLELEAQRVEKMRELDDIQNDYSVENQKQALDDEYDQFERANKLKQDQIDATLKVQLRALETEYKAYEDNINAKIKALEEYLGNTGAITADAMKLLKDKTKEFFDELSAWSIRAGNKADELTRKWMAAFGSLVNYVQMAMIAANIEDGGGVTGGAAWDDDDKDAWDIFYGKKKKKHSGGFIGEIPKLKSDEEFVKVLKGEYVATQQDMSNFMNIVLPKMVTTNPSFGSVGDINITIPVQGSLDKSVIPDLKSVIFDTINNVLKERGIRRPASAFSI